MNYRHAYHAGNFADVMKHLALALTLDHMRRKDTPFFALDAHGGIGLYDLSRAEAQKTGEAQGGILRFQGVESARMPDDFRLYHDIVGSDVAAGRYPGSPLIIARQMRAQDRMVANELHREDVVTLKQTLRPFQGASVTHLDAYEAIRAHLPPRERRGLVLIDPPFEKTNEFDVLAAQMAQWKKRFAHGVYLVWYPIKAHLPCGELKRAAAALSIPRTWCAEVHLYPPLQKETFNGCGIILFNAGFEMPERLEALMPFLKDRMGLTAHSCAWLTKP
jgi:23S rRNA (adenine2030-N6)-methyltransferase